MFNITFLRESAGEESTNGATRGLLVSEQEKLMGRVLEEALRQHPQQQHRAVYSWPERDKLSSGWLLSLPGHDSTLTAAEFSECVATLLALPSPACSDPLKLGQKIGKRRVDVYGDNVVSQKVSGDGWRKRHDQIKNKIYSLLKWSGIEVNCEVFNLFAGLIPQQGLSRIERGRKRQGMVADFMVRLPGGAGEAGGGRGGGAVSVLAELKVVSSCPTWYHRAPRNSIKAVKRRADGLPADYLRKADKMDHQFGGVPEGQDGPVRRKLLTFPFRSWVFGAWGEASDDVHELVHCLVASRLRHEETLEGGGGRRRGMSDKGALAVLTGQVRRTLSLEAARANARCLLERVEVVGSGGKAATGRRWEAEAVERRMRREQRANMLSLQYGRSVRRRGQFYLQ